MEAEDQCLAEEACGSRRSLDDHLRVGEQPDEAIDASVVRREPGRGVDRLLQVRGMKHAIAESEGAENVAIQKKVLKSGREIWTVGGAQ